MRKKAQKASLWEGVAAALRQNIRAHELQPGEQLPTELQLAETHGVSRFTVRQALAELEAEGLVRIEHGRGLFVAEEVIPFVLNERTRFSENLRRLQLSGGRKFLSAYTEPADDIVRTSLGLPDKADVVVANTLISVGDRPVGLISNWYPSPRFDGIGDLLRENSSQTEALRSFGVLDYTRKQTRIVSRMPSKQEAELLEIPRARPLLITLKVDVDLDDNPVAYGVSCFTAERVQLVVE